MNSKQSTVGSLQLRQLIDEAKEYSRNLWHGVTHDPCINTLWSLRLYLAGLNKVVMHSGCPEIVAKANMKLDQLQMLLSIYDERKN